MDSSGDKISGRVEFSADYGGLSFPRLALTAFIAGFCIMVIEVLGSRVIGPFFGVGLFVWTSLIAVTMIALAAGYIAGGVLADKWESPDRMYWIIGAAGIMTALVPLLKVTVLKLFVSFGVRLGAFASSLVLFGPPLMLLGCVSPYLIRLAARRIENVGKTVGALYGISTVGSIAGTIVVGYYLIAVIEVSTVFSITGALLCSMTLLHFVLMRKKKAIAGAVLALVLCLAAFSSQTAGAQERTLKGGTKAKLVHKKDGYYGAIRVIDYSFGPMRTRELSIDGLIQGGIDANTGKPVYEYLYFMEFLPVGVRPGGERCLVLGLGAGVVPMWYEEHGIKTDVVDIDPNVLDVAKTYFGLKLRGDVFIEDARYYLKNTERVYDYLVLDVFNGDSTPTHLISLEAFRQAKDRLAAGGVLAINLHGALGVGGEMTAAVVRTLDQVFDNVDVYPTFDPKKTSRGNIALIAYDGSPVNPKQAWLSGIDVHPLANAAVQSFAARKVESGSLVGNLILTDDFNPMDILEGPRREEIRKSIIEEGHSDLLL